MLEGAAMSITETPARPSSESGLSPTRIAGILSIAAAVVMLVGAALWAALGADIDAAVTDGTVAEHARDIADNVGLEVAHLAVWIVGVTLLAFAAVAHAGTTDVRRDVARLGAAAALIGAATAIVAFLAMATFAHLAPQADSTSMPTLEALAFLGSRLDWVATIGVVGLAPAFLAQAATRTWAPRWLVIWGYVAGALGVLTAVAIFAGGLGTYGFVIVPVGLGWYIAAGVVQLRRS
jgi:hypothetical protein